MVLYKYPECVCSYKHIYVRSSIKSIYIYIQHNTYTAQIHLFFVLCNMACWAVCILYITMMSMVFVKIYHHILRTTHNVKVNINRWKLQWKIESDKLQNAICQWMSAYVLTFNSDKTRSRVYFGKQLRFCMLFSCFINFWLGGTIYIYPSSTRVYDKMSSTINKINLNLKLWIG